VGLAKNLLVWIVFLSIPIAYIDKDGQWKYKRVETFDWLQLVGFITVVFGFLVFNEILEIPWFGLNKNLKKELLKREALKQGEGPN
jgi:hypothetical protein